MYPIKITPAINKRQLYLLSRFMIKQPQYYPNFDKWLHKKCLPNIEKGNYKSIIILSNQSEVVGDVVYEIKDKKTVKLKNLRIDPLYRKRDLGHFLLSQVSHDTENLNMILDITVDNFAGVEFFIRNGFKIMKKAKLYLSTQDEFIMKRASF